MRHIRNTLVVTPAAGDIFEITESQWHAAHARAGHPPGTVSFARSGPGLATALAEADTIITGPAILAEILSLPTPRLETVFQTAAGVDRLAGRAWPRGVRLLNNRGVHGPKLFEFIAWALLALHLRAPELAAQQAAHRWEPLFTRNIQGTRLTVIGTGDLGGAAARAGQVLGMDVTGISRQGRSHPACARVLPTASLDDVLPQTEALVLACPLTPATRGLLDARRMALLPAGARIVNVGRGALLDQSALIAALEAGHLGGAVLDVTDPEPPPPGDRLWSTRNLIVTPHISADDPTVYNDQTLDIFFATVDADNPPNLVDLTLGY